MSDICFPKMNFLDEILGNINGFSSVRRKTSIKTWWVDTNHPELLMLELKSIKYLIFFPSMVEPSTNLVNRIFGLKIILEIFLDILKLLKKSHLLSISFLQVEHEHWKGGPKAFQTYIKCSNLIIVYPHRNILTLIISVHINELKTMYNEYVLWRSWVLCVRLNEQPQVGENMQTSVKEWCLTWQWFSPCLFENLAYCL